MTRQLSPPIPRPPRSGNAISYDEFLRRDWPNPHVEWVRGDHITLAANDSYWGGRPAIDGAIIRVINDNAARFFELQSGGIDMMEFPNPDDVKVAQANPALQVLFRPSLNVAYLDFNEFQQPFQDVRVRQVSTVGVAVEGAVQVGAGVGHHLDLADVELDAWDVVAAGLLAAEVVADDRGGQAPVGDQAVLHRGITTES